MIHEQVCHQRFGTGAVISQTESMIEVEFDSEYGIKKFVYPSVFENFLRLSDEELQKRMDDNLRQIRQQMEIEKKQKAEEAQKRREEERQTLLEQKRVAAKKTSVKSKK